MLFRALFFPFYFGFWPYPDVLRVYSWLCAQRGKGNCYAFFPALSHASVFEPSELTIVNSEAPIKTLLVIWNISLRRYFLQSHNYSNADSLLILFWCYSSHTSWSLCFLAIFLYEVSHCRPFLYFFGTEERTASCLSNIARVSWIILPENDGSCCWKLTWIWDWKYIFRSCLFL